MEEQLEQAINIASQGTGDAGLRQQALEYCNEVRNSENGWQVCLSIATSDQPKSEQARHFSLQVVDSQLARLSQDEVIIIRDRLFSYLRTMLNAAEMEPVHMRNKVSETLGYVFIMSYQSQWITFFDDLFALMGNESSEVGNPKAVDMYLRILKTIHEEIGDNLIARTKEQTDRNNVLKDLIRERAMSKLAASWMTILQYYKSQEGSLANEIVGSTLKVIGGWVSWIDITLIVNSTYMQLIFEMLNNENQRLFACDALYEIIAKKMKPGDKLELIGLLSPGSFLNQLGGSGDLEFEERVAKLSNIVALELIRIMNGTMETSSGVSVTQQQIEQSESILINMMPVIFNFLSNEYDDTSSQVFPCLSDYLAFIRKECKKQKDSYDYSNHTKNAQGQLLDPPSDSTFVPVQRRELLSVMLNKMILKMRYDEDMEWTGGDDESESEFLDIRGRLKVMQTQIATIDQDLFREIVVQFVNGSLDGTYGNNWQDVELGLFELSAFSEAIRSGAILTVRGVESKSQVVLYELFFKMVNSEIIGAVNHPSVHLLYMELCERHSAFLQQQPEQIQRVLQVFISPLGVHNSNLRVRARAWYLLYRFVKNTRQVVSNLAEHIFVSLGSLLEIKAQVPTDDDSSESNNNNDDDSSNFDSQLYLFETLGILFGSSEDSLVERLLQPIFSNVEQALSQNPATSDSQPALQIHHDLMAIGTFMRGLEASGTKAAHPTQVKQASQVVLVVLERLPQLECIRSSARTAISAMVPILESEVLPEVSRLIQALLEGSEISELPDFLGFLGQLIHTFKSQTAMFEMFTSLLSPLIERMVVSLEQANNDASTGSTDAIVTRQDLRRSYLSFIFNVLNNGMGAIFIAEQNSQAFSSVMQTVLSDSKDISDPTTEKTALSTLHKMFGVWGDGYMRADSSVSSTSSSSSPQVQTFGEGNPVPGFDDSFIFEHFSGACWELIAKPGFNPKDAQLRACLGEAAALQKTLVERKPHYAQYLAERYLPMVGLPSDLSQEYTKNLTSLTKKDFKKYFYEFVIRIAS